MTGILKASLYLQLLWVGLALTYNTLSLLAIAYGGSGFAGDAATTISASLAVLVFLTVTVFGFLEWTRSYRFFALLTCAALFVGGVWKHLHAGPAEYASHVTWAVAIAINCLGVIAYLAGFGSSIYGRGRSWSGQ